MTLTNAVRFAFARRMVRPLDRYLYALQLLRPFLTRFFTGTRPVGALSSFASIHLLFAKIQVILPARCSWRHAEAAHVQTLPDGVPDPLFDQWRSGSAFRIDIAEVRTGEGAQLLPLVATDRAITSALAQLIKNADWKVAWAFINHLS